MRRAFISLLVALAWAIPSLPQAQQQRTSFTVKYVAQGIVYLDGGRSDGLAEGMTMSVRGIAAPENREGSSIIAELMVTGVARNSAVCEVKSSTSPLKPGDIAVLSTDDAQRSQILRAAGGGNHYAQTITFSEGDPVDEETRASVPRPPLPEVNRVRGRLGFEYYGIHDQGGSGMNSADVGIVLRTDMTRIGGSYWNLSGYSRFRANSRSNASSEQTLTDLLNRTYHLSLSYASPRSNWVAGFGRLLLPWAASLSTLDGGYLARRVHKSVTAGVFAGSTPDPTSWNYNPDRKIAGGFVNYEGGSFDGFHYSSTTGVGVTRLAWKPENEFAFLENSVSFGHDFSLYHNLEVDRSHATVQRPSANGTAVSRSFATLRYQPSRFVSFDLNHNYFRDFPTFDLRLVGTGLLDRILFQGYSGGARVYLPKRVAVFANLGRSSGTGSSKPSWNQLYGVTANDLLGSGFRVDVHYSHFDSSFGKGNYRTLWVSRSIADILRAEVQIGQQSFSSPVTTQTRARFVNGNLDWNFAGHYFVGGGVTVYRGQTQNYLQSYVSSGYRF